MATGRYCAGALLTLRAVIQYARYPGDTRFIRFADFSNYWALRGIAENPWRVMRFRKRGIAGRDLEVRLRDGHRLYVRGGQTDFHVFNRIFVRDEYRLAVQSGALWEAVIDIGANVGIFACRAANLADRVICYEPSPANVAQLERNTHGRDGVEAVCEAVAGEPGVLRLHRPSDGSHSYGFTLYHDVQPEDPRTRLANFSAHLESKGFAVQTRPSRRRANQGNFLAERP